MPEETLPTLAGEDAPALPVTDDLFDEA
jgi:hypothetical protein